MTICDIRLPCKFTYLKIRFSDRLLMVAVTLLRFTINRWYSLVIAAI